MRQEYNMTQHQEHALINWSKSTEKCAATQKHIRKYKLCFILIYLARNSIEWARGSAAGPGPGVVNCEIGKNRNWKGIPNFGSLSFAWKRAWLLCAVMGLKGFLAPRYHLFVMKRAPSTYFFILNSKMASKNTLGHSLMTQNAPSWLYPFYQFWQVSKMECAKQGVFLEGKITKMERKNFKNFYCPKSSKISY